MKKIITIIFSIIIGVLAFYLSINTTRSEEPNNYYQVYLDEELLGTIKSKTALENYIDSESDYYKKKYGVKKVYAPEGLEIKAVTTYNKNIKTEKEIYEILKAKKSFTIDGYQITIKKEDKKDNKKVYVLDEKIFKESLSNVAKIFVGIEDYEKYVTNTQSEIKETGSLIENISMEENMTIKKVKVPVTETIYQDTSSLTKQLLFGTTSEQNKYVVQEGDTISKVAFNNKISVLEFLISNPNFTNEKNLLFPGQEVVIGVTNPQVKIKVVKNEVKDLVSSYKTEYQYDSNMYVGEEKVLQEGEEGLERINQEVTSVNGEITYVDTKSKEVIKPTTNKIVVKGDKKVSNVGSVTDWAWPTDSGWTISSEYAYRTNPITGGRELHDGIDIAGTGFGSNIYASNNGVVVTAGYHYINGNYVIINHNNGYYTYYGHMSKILTSVGNVVEKGQVIGLVGKTGYATGPHVHFSLATGGPMYGGGTIISPWTIFR